MKIVEATEQDVPTLLELIRGLAEYEKMLDKFEATEAKLRKTLFAEKPAAEALLGFEGEAAVGFAIFFTNYSTFLAKPGIYLEDLFVKPEFRGRGFGKALLRRIARIAVERGCGRMEWTVLDWNEPSIRFYESLGARQMKEWQIFRLTGESLAKLGAPS